MRTLFTLAFLCVLAAPAAAGKKVKFTEWTPPEKCIVDRGGVDDEGGNNAGLSRKVLDGKAAADFLPKCELGIDFKKMRLVRAQMISNYRTVTKVRSAQIKGGRVVIEVETAKICTGNDVYRRSLLWIVIPKGKQRVHVIQAPHPEDESCPQ